VGVLDGERTLRRLTTRRYGDAPRQLVLSALQDQRVQFDSTGQRVERALVQVATRALGRCRAPFNRYGRALVITVTAEISVPMATPPNATVTEQINHHQNAPS
jgi:hypothetical protein